MDTITPTAPRRLSWFNVAYLTVLLAGGLWCAATGVWPMAVVLLAGATLMGVVIRRALHGQGTDTRRLDAVQPFDERERAASTWSFAVVGRVALVALTALFVAQVALRRVDLVVAVGLVLLTAVWGVAIRVALRRA
ncbi:hypothetical protein [Nostocoides sp. Soil756]|uniref:hypothetical protein n=1 Tax=Nostocoides sp. Soil756 TaxID=1736399 RepID=UPI0006F31F64|nr:hypothetical protein [Tetrasphaera sp. Soil756]KRE60893.1 hypothetical protein ASG78_10970 [Tetrasphaera sp. Soil756]